MTLFLEISEQNQGCACGHVSVSAGGRQRPRISSNQNLELKPLLLSILFLSTKDCTRFTVHWSTE